MPRLSLKKRGIFLLNNDQVLQNSQKHNGTILPEKAILSDKACLSTCTVPISEL